MRIARIVAATACVFALLPPASSSAAVKSVEIPGRYFSPQRVTITVGNTVRWTNSSSERHSVKSFSSSNDQFTSSDHCPGGLLVGNDCIPSGGTYQHTFSRTGTFDYYCTIHGTQDAYPNCRMCGRVTVKPKAGAIPPTTPGTVAPTSTASSPSSTPTISDSAVSSPSASRSIAAGPGDDGNSSTLVTIAALAVALLGGTGIVVYRTMIRR